MISHATSADQGTSRHRTSFDAKSRVRTSAARRVNTWFCNLYVGYLVDFNLRPSKMLLDEHVGEFLPKFSRHERTLGGASDLHDESDGYFASWFEGF